MPEPGSVPYISPDQVVACVALMEPGLKTKIGEVYGRDHQKLAAAMCVFGMYFGPDWLLSRLGHSPFMRPPIRVGTDEYKTVDRIIRLAEHLVNLQQIAGFQHCLEEIRTDSIESGLAKLVAAGMLRRRGIPFHFVVPTGQLGHDYDAEALIGATRVPIEMKAKIEGKEPSPTSVANTLKRARGQFPRDTPNVVFLRVPGPWGETAEGAKAILEGAEQEFNDSGAIGMVVAHWERWLTAEKPGGVGRGDRLLVIVSKVARVHLTALESVLLQEPPVGAFPWLSFDELFASGQVRMRYAHLCQGVTESYPFATFERLTMGVIVPTTGRGHFPVPSVLVSSFDAAGGAPARRELSITFTDNKATIISWTTAELEFKIREPGYPVTAHHVMELGIEIPGPGIYYFDYVVDRVHVGRLPVLMVADTTPTSLPTGQVQMGRAARPGIMLDWGHLLDRFEGHQDGTLTLHHVYEVWPVLSDPTKPFAMDTKLLLQLSAPTQFAGVHRLAVMARNAGRELIGDVAGDLELTGGILPGRVIGWQSVDLKTLGFPGVGDYSLEVLADDAPVGRIDVFAREARPGPGEAGSDG